MDGYIMAWELILKTPSNQEWVRLAKRIRNDELPSDKTKYVRYSNLDRINKEMVEYYLIQGIRPEKRNSAIKGILEEMLRSSNARFDIEDKGGSNQ